MQGRPIRFARVLLLALAHLACSSDESGDATGDGGSTSKSGATGDIGKSGTPATGGRPSQGGGTPVTSGDAFGEPHEGQYHLGPVDFAETEWHNACAPGGSKYRAELRESVGLGGEYLAGVSNEFARAGGVCDACILIESATGQSIVARVVTYGVAKEPGDIDVSPSVFEALHRDEYPRAMTWRFARCPEAGPLRYEFQTKANPYWTSLWVRNPRVPLTKLEVKSKNHASFFELRRAPDGTLTDDGGFGEGAFTFRLTGMDGQVLEDELPGFSAGELVQSARQFE
jgi:hypothetical protein